MSGQWEVAFTELLYLATFNYVVDGFFGNNDVFLCVCCGAGFHFTTQCTKMEKGSNEALLKVNMNLLTICSKCVNNNQRDVAVNILATNRNDQRVSAEIQKQSEIVKVLEEKIIEIYGQVQENSVSDFKDSLQNIESSVESLSNARDTEKVVTSTKAAEPEGIRFCGVPESKSGKPEELYKHDMEEVEKVLVHMGVDVSITDIRRLGKYEQKKTRTILIKVANAVHKRLILLSAFKLKEYAEKVFVSPEVSNEDFLREKQLLKKERN